MRPSQEHAPYSLYKKKTKSGIFWYVRFWDEEAGMYRIVRSTGIPVEGKRERWREADNAAQAILKELRQGTVQLEVEQSGPAGPAKSVAGLPEPFPFPVELSQEPPRQATVADTPFIRYLLDFWTPESGYAKYKRGVKKRPLSGYYISMNHDDVRRHVAPFPGFQGVALGQVSRKHLKEWLIWMSARKVQRKKKDGTIAEGDNLSGRRINAVLQGMRVAVRWAVDNQELVVDPFRKLDEAAEESKEKGILTPAELRTLIALPVSDPFSRLAVLLAARCGMRRGEIRGLQWGDIKDGIITIQHNYVNVDGLKSPKIKGGTVVKNSSPVPLPSDVEAVLEMVRRYSNHTEATDFVIQSRIRQGKVVSAEYFRSALARELRSIGIDEQSQKERNITFHSLRHNFVTLGRMSGLSDFEIQTLARQKSAGIMERYSHGKQAIDFEEARRKLEASLEPGQEKKATNR
ncbi:MAG: tyrosine-type recombinase/integrase [Treponema sp.]|jgi:integrase|nr:tyrosine-type recombinase/integrase [Treponema sp.]